MRILITGAAGYLATGVEEVLAAHGHTLRLADIREMETEHEFVKCDVRNVDEIIPAMKDIDVVFHTAFVSRSSFDVLFDEAPERGSVALDLMTFDINVGGTLKVLRAAQEAGVPRAVVITSEAARGQRIPITDVEICDEETPAMPDYVYALTKYVQEILCEYYTRIEGINTICLRNAGFGAPYSGSPGRTLQSMGVALLMQRSTRRSDMVNAAVLAIEKEGLEHEVFLLTNQTEFTKDEVPMLRTNPEQVIDKHYPGAVALMKEYGIDMEMVKERKLLWKLDDTSKAERLLGWKPSYTFRDFYEDLKAGKYPKDHVFPFPD